jgi:hypothetical protein
MATEDLQLSEWERSRISNQNVNMLKKLGFMKQEKTLIFPGEESYPTPRIDVKGGTKDGFISMKNTMTRKNIMSLLLMVARKSFIFILGTLKLLMKRKRRQMH